MAKKIMIIEDDADMQNLVKKRLEINGYDTFVADNGIDALEMLSEAKPDLILLDINMPRMDGYTFLKSVRRMEEFRTIPVIVITARSKMQDLFQLEGVNEYLVKPVEPEHLVSSIKKAISG